VSLSPFPRIIMQQEMYDTSGGFYRDAVQKGPAEAGSIQLEDLLPNPNTIGGGPVNVSCLVSGNPSTEELQLLCQVWCVCVCCFAYVCDFEGVGKFLCVQCGRPFARASSDVTVADITRNTDTSGVIQEWMNLSSCSNRSDLFFPGRPASFNLVQMGVTHCFAWIEEHEVNAGFLSSLVAKVEGAGLKLNNVGCRSICKSPDIILGTESRPEALKKFKDFLILLSKCNIPVTTFTWEPEG